MGEQAEDASTVASLSAASLQVAMPKQSPPAQQSMPEVAEWAEVVSKRTTRAEKKLEEKKPEEKKQLLRQQCNCCLLPGLHFADKCIIKAKQNAFAEREAKRRTWEEKQEQRLEKQLAWQERRDAWEAHQARREGRYSAFKEWQDMKGKRDDACDASTVASETCNLRS